MSADTIAAPDDDEVTAVVEAALPAGAVVVLFAACEVEYDGRASGYLGPGERLVVCKPDGTLLVHRPTGHDPVNWQPPGSTITVERSDGDLAVTARRSNPDEHVRVLLRTVYAATRFDGDDTAPLSLSGTEADMHEYIIENPDVVEDGLRVVEHERDTPYGLVDIFATDASGRPVVVEVKRRQATLSHVDQLRRYMAAYRESNPDARGVLAAPDASDRVKRTLRDNDLEFAAVSEFASTRGSLASTTFADFESTSG